MKLLPVLSIALELMVAAMGLKLALIARKGWGWALALTYALYVFYDLTRLLSWDVPERVLQAVFFVASLSIWTAVFRIEKELSGPKKGS